MSIESAAAATLRQSEMGSNSPEKLLLVSFTRPSPGLMPPDFLRLSRDKERFYWEDGNHDVAFAGFGVATNLMAWGTERFERIQRQALSLFSEAIWIDHQEPLSGPRLFGGFSFRDDFVSDNTWSVFSPAQFVLPHFQLARIGRDSWLTINTLLPPDEYSADIIGQLRAAADARYDSLVAAQANLREDDESSSVVDIDYPMSYEQWARMISNATTQMRSSELKKVVLSRVCEVRLDRRVNVDQALSHLNEHYARCYRFLFEPRPYHVFYGATPELLAEVEGDRLTTMALASSIRRGASRAEDEALGRELLADPKERYEHELVASALRRRLEPMVDDLEMPDQPEIYRLSNIQHLYTPVRARLKRPDGVVPVVQALHPTPALGGSPRDLAMAFIKEAEPVPRGWYAGPVGCIDHRMDGSFGVAIRSAVSQERRVWLYAGGGIVADSVPRKEWDETALKFRPMLNALGIEMNV